MSVCVRARGDGGGGDVTYCWPGCVPPHGRAPGWYARFARSLHSLVGAWVPHGEPPDTSLTPRYSPLNGPSGPALLAISSAVYSSLISFDPNSFIQCFYPAHRPPMRTRPMLSPIPYPYHQHQHHQRMLAPQHICHDAHLFPIAIAACTLYIVIRARVVCIPTYLISLRLGV